MEFRNVEVLNTLNLKSWWEGPRSKEPGVDREESEKG
jgi:hypothetical protein